MTGTRRARVVALAATVACVLALLPAAGAAAAPVTPECATAMPVAQLQALLDAAGTDPDTGEQIPVAADGLTVVRGTTPQAFAADILAIDYGGAGIDHDLIIAELSGLGIDADRGVWAGMSGSPVYIGEQLIGAVAYGFTWGPSALAGITPAEEMFELTSAGMTEASAPSAMRLSTQQRMSIAAQTDQSVTSVPGRVPRLQVPLGINVSSERLKWLQREASEDGSRLTPVAGSGFSVNAAATSHILAGSNFAAALSYGDITAGGTGTTTWTCGDEALAFGHPFMWSGRTKLSLHNARAVSIAVDPIFGSYKLATLGAPVGTVDQDRYTGIHGTTAAPPETTEITSFTVAEHDDGTFTSDSGLTNVALPEYVPFTAFIHGFSNIDFELDRYFSAGSSEITWTADMLHGGNTYRLERANQFNSPYDISIESMFEPWMQLEQLANSQFGKVEFTNIKLRAEAVDTQRYFSVRKLQIRRDGRWITPSSENILRVDPGSTLRVRTVLHRYEGGQHIATRRPRSIFTVPRRAAGAYGELFAGRAGGHEGESEGDFCFIESECSVNGTDTPTFQSLVDKLANRPRNDELRVRLSLMTMSEDGEGEMIRRKTETMLPRVVQGGAWIPVRVRRR